MRVCLTTICIGQKYLEIYNRLFRASQEAYAKKHGYDFEVVTDYISDIKHYSLICLNKTLLCKYNWRVAYDFIVYVDADLIININSPPIHESCDFGDKIGVVSQCQPSLEAKLQIQRHKGYADVTAQDYYRIKCGYTIETDHVINGGMLVIQPAKHRDFLEGIFDRYHKNQLTSVHGFHYEQSVVGYEIQSKGLACFMDPKWNALWINHKYYYNTILGQPMVLQDFFKNNYFVHLAGQCDFDVVPNLVH